jgi:hypothetical protein
MSLYRALASVMGGTSPKGVWDYPVSFAVKDNASRTNDRGQSGLKLMASSPCQADYPDEGLPDVIEQYLSLRLDALSTAQLVLCCRTSNS